MTDPRGERCPFCPPPPERVFFEGPLVVGFRDGFSVSPGHVLLVPRRHVATWFDATMLERVALVEAIDIARAEIEKHHAPDGFNIGVNAGEAAGQTVFHLHVHVIPRYRGDVDNPRGGVRSVIPSRADPTMLREDAAPYARAAGLGMGIAAPDSGASTPLLVTGRRDPLLPHLKQHLAEAACVDIAVAFVMPGGIGLLWEHLRDVLDRGGRLRILTGDYLGATDPDALLRLLDLESADPEGIQRRVYCTGAGAAPPTAFHPKAYIFARTDGQGVAFVGSSNLSRSALRDGVEWNYRVVASRDGRGFAEIRAAFERLFLDTATVELTPQWIDDYRRRRSIAAPSVAPLPEEPLEMLDAATPHGIQEEALAALREARAAGARSGLVVLATGLGKTWLSAFDSLDFRRVLFVAHREEILGQAMQTYRRIRPHDYLGHYSGREKHPQASVVFASVQTLARPEHLERFQAGHFDYVVIDEFHHASAATYRRLLGHFRPQFLLGLTATPERSDGADLLALCDGNLVYRCDLAEGIRRELLCPFRYFGVPDLVDYRNIPWRSTRFDEEALTTAVATRARAENALEQLESRGGSRVLAFCVSQRHADFMAEFFREKGWRAAAVHSGPGSDPRTASLEKLQAGELDVVCAVDMFNEGVDLPELDTILMLRPTESRILWLQQFGRGLRRAGPDKKLAVIDYIGNHRTFLLKPQTLFGLGAGDREIQNLLERLEAQTQELPPGCEVTYDLEAKDILRGLLRVGRSDADVLRTYVRDFVERHGVRPTATETHRDGYSPRAVRAGSGSWFSFLKNAGLLEPSQEAAWNEAGDFLDMLETTQMSRSFKMVVLLAMLNEDRFPGEIAIDALVRAVRDYGERHPRVAADFGEAFASDAALRRHLVKNPIEAWCGGLGTKGHAYFVYEDGVFSSGIVVGERHRAAFQELARELAEWRLAEYLERPAGGAEGTWTLKVESTGGKETTVQLDREKERGLPEGWTPVVANEKQWSANFAATALREMRRADSDRNELAGVLRGWFGPDAGAPGTRHQVQLSREGTDWTLAPVGTGILAPMVWRSYAREQIPRLFGHEFSPGNWNSGVVSAGGKLFLLVTLDKSGAAAEHKYEERFVSPIEFQWQSQNSTARDGSKGDRFRRHAELGIEVHLFVRARKKQAGGKSSPFVYCGLVDFDRWEGDRPITIWWRLREEVPESLRRELGVGV